jgi:hypothetical protein
VEVAKLAEFRVSAALEQIKKSQQAMLTIPDEWLKEKARIDRTYLWNMLNTFHPDWVHAVTGHAYR